ncbi:HlyD family secretion protein [Pikeienuella piscinae]|uniref:HlyD family secretion protein n=1 Tax=Pikeienuella piscinae TaxID=2748098 RepID=A0A7L5BVN9_9RHOB|nr:HlyD family secretion protein [Pikeienuella piscinae]QIE55163.1 HlyD family secretion protein [Pikeienuella piscinae]
MAPKDLEIREDRSGDDVLPLGEAPFENRASARGSDAAKARPPRRKRVALLLVALGVIGGIGWFGWDWWTVGRFEVSTDDAYVGADFAILAPKVAGYIAETPVADNEAVKKDAPLVLIDDGDYRVRLKIAEAAVAAKRAAVDRLSSQIGQARAAIGGAEANIASANASLTQADADLARYEDLAKSDFASRQRLEAARAAQATARAAVAAAEAGREEAEAALEVAIASAAEAEAALKGAEAEREQAARDLEAATIRAPFDGVVGNLAVAPGDYVQPGARLLAVIPLSEVYIDANFKETQITDLRIGAPVEVHVDAYPARGFTGHIRSFAPATGSIFSLLPPENATGNFTKVVQRLPIRISVPEEIAAEGWLRPGLSVVVTADRRGAESAGADR